MKDPNLYCPPNRQAWREWLAANHQQQAAVWLVLYKKQSPGHNLSWSEAVDEALCFGWIDSTKKTIDAERYQQYFTKRKAKSNWSKVNKAKVQTLIDQGLMTAAGYKSIEIAKANGSWTILDTVEALQLPDDLKAELLHHFSFAYRNEPDVKKKVMRIREGSGHADMLQDLMDLAVLAEKYPEPLVEINFNTGLNTKAKAMSHDLAEVLANANGSKDESSDTKVRRDKVYTLLSERVRAIREVGQYVFWRNPERKAKYVNDYK